MQRKENISGLQEAIYIIKVFTKWVVRSVTAGKTSHAACMVTFALIIGKPYEGEPQVRFDEEVEETCWKIRRLYLTLQIRNSLKFVSYKDRKKLAADLKPIYQAITEEEAQEALESFEVKEVKIILR